MTINQQILALGTAEEINQLASEFVNATCEVDVAGDVWDARGNWWTDERKQAFIGWTKSRGRPANMTV